MTIKTKSARRSQEAVANGKSIKTLQTITNYLKAVLLSYVFGVFLNIWQIMAKESSSSSTELFNIVAFISLGVILVWCLQLLKQKRLLSFWVFLGFVCANLAVLFLYRLISGTALFATVDVVLCLFIAVAVFELYKLKSNGTLN